jgi:hypothetical protein
MTGTPEIDIPQAMPDAPAAQGVAPVEIPMAPEISPAMSEAGVEPTGSAAPPPTPVVSDHGATMTTVTPTTTTTLTVPANQQQLLDWAKGDPSNSLTWLSKFWIRRIKQAVKYHWNLIMPPPPVVPVQQVQGTQQFVQQPTQTPIQQVQSTQPVAQPIVQTPTQQVQPTQTVVDPQTQQNQQQSDDPDYNT